MLASPACEQLHIGVALRIAVSLVIAIQCRSLASLCPLLSACVAVRIRHVVEGSEGPPAACPSLMCFLEILACLESPYSGISIFLLYIFYVFQNRSNFFLCSRLSIADFTRGL